MVEQAVYLPEQIIMHGAPAKGTTITQSLPPFQSPKYAVESVVLPVETGTVPAQQVQLEGATVIITKDHNVVAPMGTRVLRTRSGAVPVSAEAAKADGATWMTPSRLTLDQADPTRVLDSWRGRFAFVEEEQPDPADTSQSGAAAAYLPGLREPQAGALFAVLGYWKIEGNRATPGLVVMPTGTGKTETMLALLVQQRIPCLVVIVPTVALREQLAEKFRTLGRLWSMGVIAVGAECPVVAVLTKRIQTPTEMTAVFNRANVVVANVQNLTGLLPDVATVVRQYSTHLFVDEAHHVAAPTWMALRHLLDGRPTLFFTATPYRQDGRPIEATPVFNYSLRQAQARDYFKKIHFVPVDDPYEDSKDETIAEAAVQALRRDLAPPHPRNHQLMARTNTIAHAEVLLDLYQRKYPDLQPVLVTSQSKAIERKAALAAVRAGQAKIVVCVDMLGEGYDLPELKIAALHRVHKSLAITLQFIGRFTRHRTDLGDATVVANLAEAEVKQDLKDLYAEGADWSFLLQEKSTQTAGARLSLNHFVTGFDRQPDFLSLYSLTPRLSTVIYRTGTDPWEPLRLADEFSAEEILDGPFYNQEHEVVLLATREQEKVEWSAAHDLRETHWHLHLLHWNERQQLLYVYSTVPRTFSPGLARAVAGPDVVRVTGEPAYRVFARMKEIVLTNLGLKPAFGKALSFEMRAGADVLKALSEAATHNKLKSNLFGLGFQDGHFLNVGASSRGRFWSLSGCADIPAWVAWCDGLGELVLDTSLNIDHIIRNAVRPEALTSRPAAVPLFVDWHDEVYSFPEDRVCIVLNGAAPVSLLHVSLILLTFDDASPIQFAVQTDEHRADFQLSFGSDGRLEYQLLTGSAAVQINSRALRPLVDWFNDGAPPTIYFDDRSRLWGGEFARLSDVLSPFAKERIEPWTWPVDITVESQRKERNPDSVQYHAIQQLLQEAYDVVIDDDSAGESADIVAIRQNRDLSLQIDLFHCKYSGGPAPGARVGDLYEVCGQAQKSIRWFSDVAKLRDHLLRRDRDRVREHGAAASRFQLGTPEILKRIVLEARGHPIHHSVALVQPGLSAGGVSQDQLQLLAATELFLKERSGSPLRVISSP